MNTKINIIKEVFFSKTTYITKIIVMFANMGTILLNEETLFRTTFLREMTDKNKNDFTKHLQYFRETSIYIKFHYSKSENFTNNIIH